MDFYAQLHQERHIASWHPPRKGIRKKANLAGVRSIHNQGEDNMEDCGIVELFFSRSEQAIKETDEKYGRYCYSIAYNILANREDSEESVSDTYLSAWNLIPPRRPNSLATFLGRIVRHISIDMWRKKSAHKRGRGNVTIALEELQECVASSENIEQRFEQKELILQIRKFAAGLPDTERNVFICRYWYLDSISDIAKRFGCTESKINSMLHRTRVKLENHLAQEVWR